MTENDALLPGAGRRSCQMPMGVALQGCWRALERLHGPTQLSHVASTLGNHMLHAPPPPLRNNPLCFAGSHRAVVGLRSRIKKAPLNQGDCRTRPCLPVQHLLQNTLPDDNPLWAEL